MKTAVVRYNGHGFYFNILDDRGEYHQFTLDTAGTIDLIRELRRETDAKINPDDKPAKPLLRVLRGSD